MNSNSDTGCAKLPTILVGLATIVGVAIAVLAWLMPFSPVGQSPLARQIETQPMPITPSPPTQPTKLLPTPPASSLCPDTVARSMVSTWGIGATNIDIGLWTNP